MSETTCYCEGSEPEWDYHHPKGCGDTAQAFGHVSGVSVVDACEEPIGVNNDG